MFKFCSCDKKYKGTVGAIPVNDPLTLFVEGEAKSAFVVLTKEGEGHVPVSYEMSRVEGGFYVSVPITSCGLYFYRFSIDGASYGCNDMMELTEGGGEFLQLVYSGEFHPLGGVVYQVFPDRFFACGKPKSKAGATVATDWYKTPEYLPDATGRYNTEFFGGNLKGITAKLDYIASLGTKYIYLNPIFASPSSHRYDTSDYEVIDELLGSEEDLLELVTAARSRGIGIILDGVFSHTGDDSKYFDRYNRYGTGAYTSKESPYFDWFDFSDWPNEYRSWWGIKSLPEVNETAPSYMEYMLGEGGIVDRWSKFGIAGWRLDVADELPDEFLEALRHRTNGVLIGEVWENAVRKCSYGRRRKYLWGSQLDGVTGYPFRQGIIDFVTKGDNTLLRRTVREILGDYPAKALPSVLNVLGTHDTVRILTALSGFELPLSKADRAEIRHTDEAVTKLKLASLIQYLLPGTPCLLYGDEAGLSGCEDPFCRRTYPWGRENEELLSHYRTLGRLRSRFESELGGEAEELSPSSKVFVLRRGELELAVNLGDTAYEGKTRVEPGRAALTYGGEVVFEV